MFTGQCFEHSISEFEFPNTIKLELAYLCVYLSTTLFLYSYLACLKGTLSYTGSTYHLPQGVIIPVGE